MKRYIFLAFGILYATLTHAQARSQADVSITSVSLSAAPATKPPVIANPNANAGQVLKANRPVEARLANSNNISCSITVHNENDDDAHETILVVLLPIEVNVVTAPANATLHKLNPTATMVGYITFNLGQMAVGQNITVEFSFTKSKYGNKVGAYAFSNTSDPNPANNYKDASF